MTKFIQQLLVYNDVFLEDMSNEIIYNYPPETPLESQLKQVGVCQAIQKFAAQLSEVKGWKTTKSSSILLKLDTHWFYIKADTNTIDIHNLKELLLDLYSKYKVEHAYERCIKDNAGLSLLIKFSHSDVNRTTTMSFFTSWILKIDHAGIAYLNSPVRSIMYASLLPKHYSNLIVLCSRLEAECPLRVCLLYKGSLVWTGLSSFDDTYLTVCFLNDSLNMDKSEVSSTKLGTFFLFLKSIQPQKLINLLFKQKERTKKTNGYLCSLDNLKIVYLSGVAHSIITYQVCMYNAV
jgi:First Longin domain of INTU, CCZ1 and HPS4